MQTRTLGKQGPSVSALGLGLMGMSDLYGGGDDDESVKVIHAALDAGLTLMDTGDFYGMGHNELLLGRALRASSKRDKAFIQVKFGAQRLPNGQFIGFDGSPNAVKTSLAYTLRRLGTDYVDLIHIHSCDEVDRLMDPNVHEAFDQLKAEGKVRFLGVSSHTPKLETVIRHAVRSGRSQRSDIG